MNKPKVTQTATVKDIIVVARSDESSAFMTHRIERALVLFSSHYKYSVITIHTAPGRKSVARIDISYRAKGANRADIAALCKEALWDNDSIIVPPRAVISDKETVSV